ncbi:MAG: hypothetical protein J6X72_06610, partial [Clostridia bacterium]|nr:hypothetical protein [Clostridia bacterium]
MKRTMLIFALLLALALTVLLASCSPRGESGGTTGTEGCAHVWNEGKQLTPPTCQSTGQVIYTCTVCGEKKTEVVPADPTAHSFGSSWRIVTPPTATQDGVEERVCSRCCTATTQPVKYADYSASVTEIKGKATSFKTSDFGGGSVTTNLGGSYPVPTVKPTAGQHPRVLFNAGDIAGIKRELYDVRSVTASNLFRQAVKKPTDGKLSGSKNFSDETLHKIQALALDYRLTGNQISGYSTIYAIKNALTTLDYAGMSDVTRYYGYTMYIAACVYDWCH